MSDLRAGVLLSLFSSPDYCPAVLDASDLEALSSLLSFIDADATQQASLDELCGARAVAVCAYLCARVRRKRHHAAGLADTAYAEGSSRVRRDLRELHGGKVTESMVEAELRRDATYVAHSFSLARVDEVLDTLKTLAHALDRRNRALEHLGFDQRNFSK